MAGQQSKAAEEDMELEELRYRWMLYKSKLQEAGDLRGLLKHKVQRKKIFSFYIKLYVYFFYFFVFRFL